MHILLILIAFMFIMLAPQIAGMATRLLLSLSGTQSASLPSSISPPQSQLAETSSSDGTMKLTMKKEYAAGGVATYTFSVTNRSGQVQPIFKKTVGASTVMKIPFNSWSPDNTYIYIQFVEGGLTHVLVFKTSGEPIVPGEQYLDVPVLFGARGTEYSFYEVTGWASPTLLIVNTKTSDNTKGSSFWFEVPSQAFIELSTRF